MNQLGRNSILEQSDLFSLGVTILNGIYPFKSQEKMQRLTQAQVDKRIKYMKNYYSRRFVEMIQISAQVSSQSVQKIATIVELV